MIVMPTSNSGMVCGWVAGKYDGRIAWLLSPGDFKPPFPFIEYAVDNGAFAAWTNKTKWDENSFYTHLDLTKYHKRPMWVAVPDVVTDKDATIESWHKHAPRIRKEYGYKVAFVVQDGMVTDDVPECDVVFVGGSTEWKWHNLSYFTAAFPRVHVGRVGTERMLWMAHNAGAESCDSTGWFRGGMDRLQGLLNYLEESTNGRKQMELL